VKNDEQNEYAMFESRASGSEHEKVNASNSSKSRINNFWLLLGAFRNGISTMFKKYPAFS
jgi:hypothetical protein